MFYCSFTSIVIHCYYSQGRLNTEGGQCDHVGPSLTVIILGVLILKISIFGPDLDSKKPDICTSLVKILNRNVYMLKCSNRNIIFVVQKKERNVCMFVMLESKSS